MGIDVGGTVSNGILSFEASAYNHLAFGESVTIDFVVGVFDGQIIIDQNISVTITGRNDAPLSAPDVADC